MWSLVGGKLKQDIFSGSDLRLKINEGETETEHNEQKGVKLLAESLFAAFRNSAAHEPGLEWCLNE